MLRRHRVRRAAAAAALLLLAAGCANRADRTSRAEQRPARADDAVVVASFDIPESTLLAELYAQALEQAGVPVRRELALGPRELVQPALFEGLVDLVPEYAGAMLASLDPAAPVSLDDPSAVGAELAWELSARGVSPLAAAAAQNQNAVVVSRDSATRLGLRTVSDLAPIAGQLSLGGRPECPTRTYCAVGLERVYGLQFQRFVPLESEQERAQAVIDHTVDVAVLFTTDAALTSPDLVVLTDDRHLQPAENVVPVVSARATERYGARLTSTIDAVSALLTTGSLSFLNWRVGVAGKPAAAEAHGWLVRHGVVPQ